MPPSLKIGILGTRGIPNRYGGFEECAQHLATGLVNKGHSVWAYNSHQHEYQEDTWQGVNIVHCLDPESWMGTAGQFIYDWNCITDARKRNFDIVLHLGYTSSSVWYWRWPGKSLNIVNMDGLEWKRSKYSKKVQRFLQYAEKLAALHADILVADSPGIQSYLADKYGKKSVFIPYGAEIITEPEERGLKENHLRRQGYYLAIARMEPENNIETIILGYLKSESKNPLVIVGNTANVYGAWLRKTYGTQNIIFPGGIYNTDIINDLRYHSLLYFHGHSVGGTNPSLLEAMGCSALIVAHNNPFNKAVLGNDAFYFSDPTEVCLCINNVTDKSQYATCIENNIAKIKTIYNWPAVTDKYEELFLRR
ncbi:MAG: DUF1972 domain-containing protein [Taibaiella sp.]|nr:DUF1972 domain-containing protein [Taibaiella sp.]